MNYLIKHFKDLDTLELYSLLQLRIEVFVLEQNCPYQDLDGKDLECFHVMAYDNNILIGCTRLVPPGVSYDGYASIGRVVSHPDYRLMGVGRMIMAESIRQSELLFPGYNIKISAQCYLIPFTNLFILKS